MRRPGPLRTPCARRQAVADQVQFALIEGELVLEAGDAVMALGQHQGVDALAGHRLAAGRVHPHIERSFLLEAEAAIRIIELI